MLFSYKQKVWWSPNENRAHAFSRANACYLLPLPLPVRAKAYHCKYDGICIEFLTLQQSIEPVLHKQA